jgi:LPS sulfotransferase NodH
VVTEINGHLHPSELNTSINWLCKILVVAIIFCAAYKKQKLAQWFNLDSEGDWHLAHILDALQHDGYRLFHRIATGFGQIDHVLVAPQGVFVIEAKAPLTRLGSKLPADDQSESIAQLKDELTQTHSKALWLRDKLGVLNNDYVAVQTVIVVPRLSIQVDNAGLDQAWAINPDDLHTLIVRGQPRYDSKQLAELHKRLRKIARGKR